MNEPAESNDDLAFLERLVRWQDGALSPEELTAFERDLLASPERRRLFAEAQLRSASLHDHLRRSAYDAAPPQETPIRSAVKTWRPYFAAAAGLVCGLFSASLVWAYAIPRSTEPTIRALPLANADFESTTQPEPKGMPQTFDAWSGDYTSVVGAKEGIEPKSGQRMLQMLRSDSLADSPEADSRGSDVFQVIDLRPYKTELAAATTVAELTASCASIVPAHGERYRFIVLAAAYSGSTAQLSNDFHDTLQNAIGTAQKATRLSGQAGVWQTNTTRLLLPADADFLLVKLTISQLEPRPPGHTVFPGQFIDDVHLTLTTPAHSAALAIR